MITIYADANATTPMHPLALDAMMEALKESWGNPSSAHQSGRQARLLLERARQQVSTALDARHYEVTFTSGGTESNNLAVHASLAAHPGRHIITTELEHPSASAPIYAARACGYTVTCVKTLPTGVLDLQHLASVLRPGETALVSVMWVNNETGVIQPVREACALAQAAGAFFLTDAAQAVGKLDLSLQDCPADYLVLSGHKFGGPKGVGALLTSRTPCSNVSSFRTPHPLLLGGGQENGMRSGTENVAGIAALGAAAAQITPWHFSLETGNMRDRFESGITRLFPAVQILGAQATRVSQTSLIRLPGVVASTLVHKLSALGVAVSAGSACHSGSLAPSGTLLAMGLSSKAAGEVIRVSFLASATDADVAGVLDAFDRALLNSSLRPARHSHVADPQGLALGATAGRFTGGPDWRAA